MRTTSSAVPTALLQYARAGDAAAARLQAEARGLEAALSRFHAGCSEYPVPGLHGLADRLGAAARATGEHAAWVAGVAAAFATADSDAATPAAYPVVRIAALGVGVPRRDALRHGALPRPWRYDSLPTVAPPTEGQRVATNLIASELLVLLALAEEALRTGSPLLFSGLIPPLLGALSACGLGALGLSLLADTPSWSQLPIKDAGDLLDLAGRSIWSQLPNTIDPQLRRELCARLDALNLLLRGPYDPQAPREPPAPPENTAHGAYAAISYEAGEQLVLEQLNGAGDYRVSIAGLDPSKPGAPNNFEAVDITGYGTADENHYYQLVRARFLAALEQIPPGSTLHLQGHSMGGGMCLLLAADAEVRRRLEEAGVSVGSLTAFGAVVPTQLDRDQLFAATGAFADTELRAFVDGSDSLALNVGAGYGDYPGVLRVGGTTIDAPQHAHGDYGNAANYGNVPPKLRGLPYAIDRDFYERSVPGSPPPALAAPVAGPAPTPRPTPTPAPTPAPPPAPTPAPTPTHAPPPAPTPTPTPTP